MEYSEEKLNETISYFDNLLRSEIYIQNTPKYNFEITEGFDNPKKCFSGSPFGIDFLSCPLIKLTNEDHYKNTYLMWRLDLNDIGDENIYEVIKEFLNQKKAYIKNEASNYKTLDYTKCRFGTQHPLNGENHFMIMGDEIIIVFKLYGELYK